MSLNFEKREYIDRETVITSENLNDIQDAILELDRLKYEKPVGGMPRGDISQSVTKEINNYGVCGTASNAGTKEISIPGVGEYVDGLSIRVRFTNGDVYGDGVQINLNGLGQIPVSGGNIQCQAGSVFDFVYSGGYWVVLGSAIASASEYGWGNTRLSNSATSDSQSYSVTPYVVDSLWENLLSDYPPYEETTYLVGDRVRNGFNLWECNTQISVAEPWTEAHWTKIDTFLDQIEGVKEASVPAGGVAQQVLKKRSDNDFDVYWSSGSGSGLEGDYLDLQNKPTINNIELRLNRTSSELGLAAISDIPVAYENNPEMDGSASPGGSSTVAYAKGDHIHPTDTSRAPLASPALTGTPTAPTASDGDNTTKIATTEFVQKTVSRYTRENHLDNWYFVGGGSNVAYGKFPINSRGSSSYTTSGYCIDRWYYKVNSTGTLSLTASGVSIPDGNDLRQLLYASEYLGKKVVFTVYSSLGLNSVVADIPSTYPGGYSLIAQNLDGKISIAFDISNSIHVNITGNQTVYAAKLEVGGEQSLAHQESGSWVLNELPKFTEQLFDCQTAFDDSNDKYSGKPVSCWFYGVDELGLTVGSATVLQVWSAMPNGTAAFLGYDQLAASQRPTANGVFLIHKLATSGVIMYFSESGESQGEAIYRMAINSSNQPSEIWMSLWQTNYSPVIGYALDSTLYLTVNHIGATLRSSYVSGHESLDATLCITQTNSSNMPLGSEIAFVPIYGRNTKLLLSGVRLVLPSGVISALSENVTLILGKYQMIGMKKIESNTAEYGDVWILSGEAEVATS